jgi:hypothetical protein
MALTLLTSTNLVQKLFPTAASGTGQGGADQLPGNTITNAVGIVGAAVDGELIPANAVLNGPDWVFTGSQSDASAVTFDAPILSLLKKYAASQSGVTSFLVKAKIHARSAAVATSGYWEIVQRFDDIAGTITAMGAAGTVTVALEGAATTDPTLTVSTTNIRTTVTTLAACSVRVELFVEHAF